MNDGPIPNPNVVRVARGTGYHRVEGKRRASRNGRVSDPPPEIPEVSIRQLSHRLQEESSGDETGRIPSILRLAAELEAAETRPLLLRRETPQPAISVWSSSSDEDGGEEAVGWAGAAAAKAQEAVQRGAPALSGDPAVPRCVRVLVPVALAATAAVFVCSNLVVRPNPEFISTTVLKTLNAF